MTSVFTCNATIASPAFAFALALASGAASAQTLARQGTSGHAVGLSFLHSRLDAQYDNGPSSFDSRAEDHSSSASRIDTGQTNIR
jgi:hypothetical protein